MTTTNETILGVRLSTDWTRDDEAIAERAGIVLQAVDTLPADAADVAERARAAGYQTLAMRPDGNASRLVEWANLDAHVLNYDVLAV